MNRRRILGTLAAVAGITLAGAIPAQASTGLCWVSSDKAARLSVTRYAVSGGVQYHLDENSSTPILGTKYWQASITVSGVTVSGTNDVYKTYAGTQSRTIRGYWNTSTGLTTSCAVTL